LGAGRSPNQQPRSYDTGPGLQLLLGTLAHHIQELSHRANGAQSELSLHYLKDY